MDFDALYQAHFRDVFVYLRSLSASEDMAEELAQETFVRALKAIDRFDGRQDIRAWLFTIARNAYYSAENMESRRYAQYRSGDTTMKYSSSKFSASPTSTRRLCRPAPRGSSAHLRLSARW